jgi:hypothetical protein
MHEQQLKAVKDLRECDHAFLNASGVNKYAKAFGLEGQIKPTRHYADPDAPKGLILKNNAKSAIGMDAAVLAETICTLLTVDYLTMWGRGSQLRACCDALKKHFSESD